MSTYVGGSWTLLANHQIWSYSGKCNMYFQVYAYSTQDIKNNTSTVYTRARILVQNNNPNYTGYSVDQTWKCGLTGASDYSWSGIIRDGGAGETTEKILRDGSFTVNHNSDGAGYSNVYYWFDGSYTGHIGTNGVGITLPTIDRSAPKATLDETGSTYNTVYCNIKVPFDSSVNQRSKDGTNWTDWNKSIKANVAFKDTWTGLSPNTTYTMYYRFRRDYNEVWSETVSFTQKTKYPNAPSKGTLAVSSVSATSAKLNWSGFSLSDGATDYYYQTSSDGKSWTNQAKNTELSLSGLKPTTKYTYYARLVDNYGTASDSASASFTTTNPNKPNVGGIGCEEITPNGGSFYWYGFSVNDGATIDHYEYSLDNSKWTNVGTKTSLTLDGLSPQISYVLYVRIVDNYGTSSDSATFSFTTLSDQFKIAYNSDTYENELLTMDGNTISAIDGNILIVDVLGRERLRKAKVFYNDNGTIKKVKNVYFNQKGNIKKFKNYRE